MIDQDGLVRGHRRCRVAGWSRWLESEYETEKKAGDMNVEHGCAPMPLYIVDDPYVDPVPPADAWAAFLASRFSKRKELYEKFSDHEREIVRKELRRIRHLREYFEEHRLSGTDSTTLLASLEKAHHAWRSQAGRGCKEELHRLEVGIARSSGYRRQQLNRQRLILKQVEQWSQPTYQYEELRNSVAPESFVPGLEAVDYNVDDNPAEPNYGYNGWIMAFKKGKGGVTLDHPLCHGKFPHQKIAMQKLLYDEERTPLKRSPDRTQLRYFHLQANNMKWDAIARYYEEDSSQLDPTRGLSQRGLYQPTTKKTQSNTEKLLKRELWHGQERGGGSNHLPPHSRQIRPRCAFVPSAPWKDDTGDQPGTPQDQGQGQSQVRHSEASLQETTETYLRSSESRDIVLFMPYLHWEIEKRLARMTNVIRKTQHMHERQFAFERDSKRRGTWSSVVERARAMASRMDSTASELGGWSHDAPPWRPQSPLGRYIWLAAKLYQLIDEAADWRLITDHLCTQSPLHPRRTLEQYYNWTSEDTAHRDRQQVVYRGTRMRNDPEAIARVVVVDQLWLWILDENTILTAFPRRWGRNNPDPSAVHRAIRDRLGAADTKQITSIYELALVIIDECSKVFFDRTKPDLRPEVVDMFGSAISNISEKKTEAYERFGRDVKRMNNQDPLQTDEELLRKTLNIKFEWSVLMEAQNVIDQLQIMQEIFTQQITVMGDFEKALRGLSSDPPDGLKTAIDRAGQLILDMKLRRDELANLEKRQANTRSQLRELLDMKQQQAGIIEAKAAIRRADETVIQGRSIVVFTVVTIFFLPLSFFATVFGMNAQELDSGTMSMGTQFMWMFLLSSIVITLSLALAFNEQARQWVFRAFRSCFVFLIRPVVNRNKNDSSNLAAASPRAIREFMLTKQKEWEGTDGATSTGSLPLHRNEEPKKGVTARLTQMWRRESV
ncbi:uncharacterized protein P884DRAFT_280440 [Thermothelomyces heterothallicus CBS 202.75]|uniref:uncharacterized protein n=1 Tax=Thermothelomyces heterothallicus CBS 202.75 TaxID=1149848 RepID=UPI0037445BCB